VPAKENGAKKNGVQKNGAKKNHDLSALVKELQQNRSVLKATATRKPSQIKKN